MEAVRRHTAAGRRAAGAYGWRLLRAGLLCLPVLVLLPHLAQFAFQPGAEFSDLLISHYPNAVLIRQSLREWGTVPLWSPLILGGYPFAANPLAGLFYPPGWAALILPLPLGFNLLAALHLVWGGAGMYRFLRGEGLNRPAALLGGLTFAGLPKLYAHLAAGHLTLLYAVAWTPWLLLAEQRRGSLGQAGWMLPGVVLGAVVLADVRWAAYAGLLWLGYSFHRQRLNRQTEQPFGRPAHERARPALLRRLIVLVSPRIGAVLLAGLCAAALLLPLAEYTALSTRSRMTAGETLILSMPLARLLGLVYPTLGGSAEWTLYPGGITLALTLLALAVPVLRRKIAFWLGVSGLALLFALGSHLPLLDTAARLPGLSLLRVPPRTLFLSGLGCAVTAAAALDFLTRRPQGERPPGGRASSVRPSGDRSGLALFGAAALVVMLAAAVIITVDQLLTRVQFGWGALFFAAGAALILLRRSGRIGTNILAAGLVAAGLIDLMGVNVQSLEFRSADTLSPEAGEVARYLKTAARAGVQARGLVEPPLGPFRVYSPSYSLPQHTGAEYGLEQAGGVDPLQLAAYAAALNEAAGIESSGYSVTLPPFASGSPESDNRGARLDAARLGLFNIEFVAAEYDLDGTGLRLLARFGETRVYANPHALPRAWVQDPAAPPGTTLRSIPEIETRPNRIRLAAEGPGLLVLAENAYPGWTARVDGRPAAVETVSGLLRGVTLEPGRHVVEFEFRPQTVFWGIALSLAAWTAAAVGLAVPYKRRGQCSGGGRSER